LKRKRVPVRTATRTATRTEKIRFFHAFTAIVTTSALRSDVIKGKGFVFRVKVQESLPSTQMPLYSTPYTINYPLSTMHHM